MTAPVSELPAHVLLPEPPLAFHPERPDERHPHPLRGLVQFGPYSRKLIAAVHDPIQTAAIGTRAGLSHLAGLLREIEATHAPQERRQYLPDFPGFARVFGTRLAPPTSQLTVALPDDLDRQLASSATPHLLLADAVKRALATLEGDRSLFSLAFIVLPEAWSGAFTHKDEDFNLRSFIKATAAGLGIPTQILGDRVGGPFSYRCRCSVMWRIGIAAYVKAGGVPWKIADPDPDTAYVGIGYALRSPEDRRARFVVCCTQVFDSDGAGMEFVAYETDDYQTDLSRRNPFLSRQAMRRLMSRSIQLYQRRNEGRVPRVVVVHKSTEFRRDEVDGCFDALSPSERIELLHIQEDTLWRGVELTQKPGSPKGAGSRYPCSRGSLLPLAEDKFLLWSQGNARDAVGGRDFFKEGKGIPSPLLVTRHAGHGSWAEPGRAILGLSKMNWNNDGLYDRVPVTTAYAHELALIAKSVSLLSSRPYHIRYFM